MTKKNHRTTSRIVDILELLSNSDKGFSLTEICKELDVPKSSMSPVIHTLLDRNVLALNEKTNKYFIGRTAFKVGSSFLENFDIMDEIQKEMQKIVDVCEETVHLGILVDGNVFYLKKIDSPKSIRMIATVGKTIPAYGTAIGKSLLLDNNLEELKKMYPDGLKKLTDNTITSFQKLNKQLNEARQNNITYEIEESNEHVRCLAVPIRKDKKIITAISVAFPVFRYSKEKADLSKQLLFNAKEKIEKLLKEVNVDFSIFLQ